MKGPIWSREIRGDKKTLTLRQLPRRADYCRFSQKMEKQGEGKGSMFAYLIIK